MAEIFSSTAVRAAIVLTGMVVLHLMGEKLMLMVAPPVHLSTYPWETIGTYINLHFSTVGKLPSLKDISILTGLSEGKVLSLGWELTWLFVLNSLLRFLVPGLAVLILTVRLSGQGSWWSAMLCVLLVVVLYPVVDGIASLMDEWLQNTSVLPPSAMELSRRSEGMMIYLLSWAAQQHTMGLALAVVSMCVLPAISEELFFRGAMFSALQAMGMRQWLVIALTALAFALFHLSPSKFLSILLTGVVMGYLRALCGGLILPVVFHFSNNLLRVLVALSTQHTTALTAPVRWVVEQPALLFLLVVAGIGILILLHRTHTRYTTVPSL